MPHVDDRCTTHHACDCIQARVRELEAEIAERDAAHRRIIEEQCPTDEQHCACVPALRQEVARLTNSLTKLEKAVNESVSGIRRVDVAEWLALLSEAQRALAGED